MKQFVFLFLLVSIAARLHAQWSVQRPFDQRLFIENKGQYFIKDKSLEMEILYGSREGNEQYFFTKKGVCIMSYKRARRSEKEIEEILGTLSTEEIENKKSAGEKELAFKNIPEFHEIEWLDCNPNAEVIAEKVVSETYNYSDIRQPNLVRTIQAHGYKKIIFKNIYPNIDIEYLFPEDKGGYKYNLILHPGADAHDIKMKYGKHEELSIDKDHNLNIKSDLGTFIDHAPSAFGANNKNINCSFFIKKNIVSFILPTYLITEKTIIDPWVSNPNYATWTGAYDVDYDNTGNVYINGGSYPYQIKKYDPNGVLFWTFTCNSFIPLSGGDAHYGDFAVDKNSESVYIVEGYDASGAKVLKLNSAGTLTATFAGNSQFREMWRISFNNCTRQAVIAGGGTSTPSYKGSMLDTNLTTLTLGSLTGTTYSDDDVALLALDNFGSAYFVTSLGPYLTAPYGQLIKINLPALSPILYSVPAGIIPQEVNSYFNIPSGSGLGTYAISNGFNGITTSNTKVYIYNGYAIKKWDGTNGALTKYKRVSYPANDSSIFRWTGIAADECDNIFVASRDSIKQYDSNLDFVTGIHATDTIYDLALGPNNILYVCGKGFVSTFSVSTAGCGTCNPTGIHSNSQRGFSVYPNPTNNLINIQSGTELGAISIFNSLGEVVICVKTKNTKEQIDISKLSTGVYVIQAKDKFVKMVKE